MSLKILSTGKGIPKLSITNDELSKIVDTNDEWIQTRTGIKERHVCTDETLGDLAIEAAQNAIKKSGLSAGDIDLIICSTLCGDYLTPSLSCVVAEGLDTSCPAFDINAACTGFIYALDTAFCYIEAGKAKNILIVCAEMMSKHADWTDRSTCVLFGDGAGAVIVTKGDALKYINIEAKGNTKPLSLVAQTGNSPFYKKQTEKGYLKMEGQEVFKFAVSMIEKELKKALEILLLQPKDIDHYILHQANKRIIDAAQTRLKEPCEKFAVNIEKYGNMSSATIPVLLDEMLEAGKIKKGEKLFLTAFGAGMTAGSCVMVWE